MSPTRPTDTAAVRYRVEPADLHAHLFRITLTIPRPQEQQEVSLPVWIPGSYLVREFSKNLQDLQALKPGDVLPFRHAENALAVVNDTPAFEVSVGTIGTQMAVQILSALTPPNSDRSPQ